MVNIETVDADGGEAETEDEEEEPGAETVETGTEEE